MNLTLRRTRIAAAVAAAGAAAALAGTAGSATAAPSTSTTAKSSTMASMTMPANRGDASYGMTKAFFNGKALSFTYTKGFFCDTGVAAKATTKCEVGAKWHHAPAGGRDPLYITVPLGFAPKRSMDCPSGITCIDHPMTMDLSRLEPALKPLYPKLTAAQLTGALENFSTPGHDHFITTTNGGKPEWWDVQVVGVTNPAVYADIVKHQSYSYIQSLLHSKKAGVLGPIPSNLFLYFGVHS